MANTILASKVEDFRSMYGGKLDQFEQLVPGLGFLKAAQSMSNTSDPREILDMDAINKIAASFGVNVSVPVLKQFAPTITNTRTCAFQTEGIESALVSLTFFTYSFGFSMAPEDHDNNTVRYQAALNKSLQGGLIQMAKTINQKMADVADAAINAYWPSGVTDFYPQVANELQVPQAEKNDLYNQADSISTQMELPAFDTIVANPRHMADVRRYFAQGAGNAVNEAFQFGGKSWFQDNSIANDSGVESTVYMMPFGSMGMYNRNAPSFVNGASIGGDYKQWSIFPNAPIVNMDLGVFYQKDCKDITDFKDSALPGLTADVAESWQFTTDCVFVTSYNSDTATKHSPIIKAEILA